MSVPKAVPGSLDDKQLAFDHALVHALYDRKRETPDAVPDWSIEDLVDYHGLLLGELKRRGMDHTVNYELDAIPVNMVTVPGLRNTVEQIAAKSIYIPEPAAERIWKGEKTLIIKGRSYSGMLNKALYYGDVHKIYGVIKLTDIREIHDYEFKKSEAKHCLTMEDRKKFWPNNQVLYAYNIEILNNFAKPLTYQYPKGVEGFFPTPKWLNNSAELTIAVNLDGAIAKMDQSLLLPERYLKAEPTSVAIETLKELGTCSNVIVFTDRDSRYYELTLKWLNKHAIPIQAFVVGPVEADITLTDFTKINPTVLCDLSLQKQYIKKTSADSADFPQNFYPGRLTEGIQTNVYGDQPNYTGLSDMVNVDYYDPHKIESVNLLEDHITVHDWWRTVQLGQPFRFDAATVKELHDSIVRELDSRGLPPHMSPIMSKADGYSLAPGGIVGVNNMGGGEAPRQDLSFKEPSPMQYGHVPEKKEDGFFFPGHRKDPKTGKILKPDRPPVNPMRKEDTWNIRFLGTAGSQETDNRHNSSIIFQDNGSDVLVDLGSINLIDKLMTKFAGAVVTHAHPDHTAGLPCLDPAVPIYMHRETWRDLLQHLPEIADKLEAHEIILVDTQNPITIGTCQFTWLPIEHHEEFNTYAILIQDCVLYSPDFSSLSDDYLKGIGTWIVDGNLLLTDEDPQAPATPVVPIDAPKLNSGHQSVLSSLKQAQRAQVPRVVVTHFSVQNDQLSPENMPTLIANLALQAGYTGDVLAARDGFVLPGGSV